MFRKILIILSILLVLGGVLAYFAYGAIFNPNVNDVQEAYEIRIPEGSSYDDVFQLLKENNVLKNYSSFDKVAQAMKYHKPVVPSGLYRIEKGWSNRKLIGVLRTGSQTPISLTFNNVRTIPELVGKISKQVAADSLSLLNYFSKKQVAEDLGFTQDNLISMFIPNTYQVEWDIKPDQLAARMKREYRSFWDRQDRAAKAEALGLTKKEVIVLASIVNQETNLPKERPIVAGLYLNRLDKSIALQADPTVVFATGNFGLRRVLNKHLAIDSPYNTYKYAGLPPGPICMPDLSSIDAVLNPAKHNYLYMCAKPGYSTEHAFAATLKQHNANANKYRKWLNQEGIR